MEYKRGLAWDIRWMSARTAGAPAGRPGPFRRLFHVQKSLKPCPLPPDDGLWLDDGDDLRPAVPQTGEQDPEHPV
jgi:hypothetical protein